MIHRSLRPRLLAALIVATAALHASPAPACLTTTCAAKDPPPGCARDSETNCWLAGEPLQWREPCVSFSVDARGIPPLGFGHADAEALAVGAVTPWLSTECNGGFPSIAVRSHGALECVKVEYNSEGPNSNAVIFQTARWPHDPIAIGVTTVSFEPSSGRVLDADIEVNLAGTGLDFYGIHYVLTHEFGHFFGIDHSRDATAVMYAQSRSSNFDGPPVLSTDDQNAICLAYPTSRAVGECDFEPEKGYSPVCGGDIEASCALDARAPENTGLPAAALLVALTGALAVARRGFARRGVGQRLSPNGRRERVG
jgi:hypothetical protein